MATATRQDRSHTLLLRLLLLSPSPRVFHSLCSTLALSNTGRMQHMTWVPRRLFTTSAQAASASVQAVPRPLTTVPDKLSGFAFYESLGSPKYLVSPMVHGSTLPYRLLCRRHGAQLCYTPMLNANRLVRRHKIPIFSTNEEDRPLIVQIAGNDPDVMVQAGKVVQDRCDGVDINFGCPQAVAKRGHYGSFLLDEPELCFRIVSAMHRSLKVPVTCKIRVLPSREATMRLVHGLVDAGCQMLTVHGRTKELKAERDKGADWAIIRDIAAAVDIPVFANGGMGTLADVNRCLEFTGCNGVMLAEAVLERPAVFDDNKTRSGEPIRAIDMCIELAHICLELGGNFLAHPDVRLRFNACPRDVVEPMLQVLTEFQEVLRNEESAIGEVCPYDTVPEVDAETAFAKMVHAGVQEGLAAGSQSSGLAYYMRHRKPATV